MCYSVYQENLNYFLQEYYVFVYNPKKNRTIKKFPAHRELRFEIKDRVYKSGKQPEINAYSVYDTEYDRIFITEGLVDMMSDATLRSKFNEDRAAWMFNVEMYLCAYHELGHLLVGHCQLCENMRLAAVETEEEKSGLDISVKTGKPQRGCQPDENTHRHPPSLARGYSTGLVFMEHMRRYFKISGDKDEFMKIFLPEKKCSEEKC